MRVRLVLFLSALFLLLLPGVPDARSESVAVPPELLDEIRSNLADAVVHETDHGMLLLDRKFRAQRVYEPVPAQYGGLLQQNIYEKLMDLMAGGSNTVVGFFLLIKQGAFVWPSNLKFEAVVSKKNREGVTLPARAAYYALVRPDDSLDWRGLGAGETAVMAPCKQRLVPPQLDEIPQVYRVYMVFPSQYYDGERFQDWNPLHPKETSYRPLDRGTAARERARPPDGTATEVHSP